jgi:tetratricopeptide (TPR) repeat protein
MASRLLALVITGALVLAPVRARAGEPASTEASEAKTREASERFDRALSFVAEGNLSAALIEFRAAYDLVPSYKVLYNIGQVHFQLRDYARALEAFERYLEDGGADVPGPRRAEVAEHIATLRARVSQVTILVNVAAQIAIDDEVVGTSPLSKPVLLGAGRHKISAVKEGYAPLTRDVDVAGARDERIALDLVAIAPRDRARQRRGNALRAARPARQDDTPLVDRRRHRRHARRRRGRERRRRPHPVERSDAPAPRGLGRLRRSNAGEDARRGE